MVGSILERSGEGTWGVSVERGRQRGEGLLKTKEGERHGEITACLVPVGQVSLSHQWSCG